MSKNPLMLCSICHHPIMPEIVTGWAGGHNAYPINEGRCCASCNSLVVVPTRISRALAEQIEEPSDTDGKLANEDGESSEAANDAWARRNFHD